MFRLEATVHGRVQGVSYRYYVRREAQGLGLTGWVRNELDGTVSVVAEGTEEKLNVLEQFLEEGSPMSNVARVDWKISPAQKEYKSFNIIWL